MEKKTSLNTSSNLIQLSNRGQGSEPATTSLIIAEKFGKQHRTVLRAIRNLECSEDFRLRNFAQSYYTNDQGKAQPMYWLTRDGFSFLAMGFTGKPAAQWKERFLVAFNAMEQELRQRRSYRATAEWLESRASGKVVRLSFTDGIKEFVEYATAQGSQHAAKYYMQLTKMENQALFLVGKGVGENFRDSLHTQQLLNLATAEAVAQRALRDGMAAGMNYRDIYQLAKQRVFALAALVGKTLPGEPLRIAA